MPLRYLFGPVSGNFGEQNLHPQRRSGVCLTFGADRHADVQIRTTDSWSEVSKQFPNGWQPDFLVLNLAEGVVPHCLCAASLSPEWAWQPTGHFGGTTTGAGCRVANWCWPTQKGPSG